MPPRPRVSRSRLTLAIVEEPPARARKGSS